MYHLQQLLGSGEGDVLQEASVVLTKLLLVNQEVRDDASNDRRLRANCDHCSL